MAMKTVVKKTVDLKAFEKSRRCVKLINMSNYIFRDLDILIGKQQYIDLNIFKPGEWPT